MLGLVLRKRVPPWQSHTRVFDLTGRPMKAWVLVEPEGLATVAQLGKWVDRAAKYAGSLLPK